MGAVALALAVTPASAVPSLKKAIWGPGQVAGSSQFPIYSDLGVGIYETTLNWDQVAPARPTRPSDPSDPAYRWPAAVSYAVAQARAAHIEVSLMLFGAPAWANGGHGSNWAPQRPEDFAAFARAAARRYPTVHLWMVWGEPSKQSNFQPFIPETRGRPLSRRQARAPRLYARMLDAAYAQLKQVNRRNLVIGANTYTVGDISTLNWIRFMRLPNGKPPRMDLYGHNPFAARKPRLASPPLGYGFADFSDLDTLGSWIDRYLTRRGVNRRGLRLFLSEFTLPTDHANYEFNFYVSRSVQADWLAAALRITHSWGRIYTLGWLSLYDDLPNSAGDEVHRGLIDAAGNKKPAYFAYKRG